VKLWPGDGALLHSHSHQLFAIGSGGGRQFGDWLVLGVADFLKSFPASSSYQSKTLKTHNPLSSHCSFIVDLIHP